MSKQLVCASVGANLDFSVFPSGGVEHVADWQGRHYFAVPDSFDPPGPWVLVPNDELPALQDQPVVQSGLDKARQEAGRLGEHVALYGYGLLSLSDLHQFVAGMVEDVTETARRVYVGPRPAKIAALLLKTENARQALEGDADALGRLSREASARGITADQLAALIIQRHDEYLVRAHDVDALEHEAFNQMKAVPPDQILVQVPLLLETLAQDLAALSVG